MAVFLLLEIDGPVRATFCDTVRRYRPEVTTMMLVPLDPSIRETPGL
jgi:hypothetical protein